MGFVQPRLNPRRAGILLPIAALPNPHGIGEIGPAARDFLRFCTEAGQRVWQILPLNITNTFGCPYASPTAFARDPLYLSVDDLIDDGHASHSDRPDVCSDRVQWSELRCRKADFFYKVARSIVAEVDLQPWRSERPWVEIWALFATLSGRHGPAWTRWPTELRDLPRTPATLTKVRAELAESIDQHIALQWAFDRQWTRIRRLAKALGVEIWGDLPFFVGGESADVWFHRALFDLRPDGRPRTVSGVPPDAFSPTGQRWGHPQFAREAHIQSGWRWWVDRIRAALHDVDVLRIDHFRGLSEVWSIPAGADTAAAGHWIPGPGQQALDTLFSRIPTARLVAEDLGIITPDVHALRDRYHLPGMAVLQFGFGPSSEVNFRPHRHQKHQVVYTGTHDNNTLQGWLDELSPEIRDHLHAYFGTDPNASALLRAAWRSVADTSIVPMQDILKLPASARTNTPGLAEGNWSWRSNKAQFTAELAATLRREVALSERGVFCE